MVGDHFKEKVLSSSWACSESFDSIEGKCKVHSEKDYTKLKKVGDDNFSCRLKYDHLKDDFELGTTFGVYV